MHDHGMWQHCEAEPRGHDTAYPLYPSGCLPEKSIMKESLPCHKFPIRQAQLGAMPCDHVVNKRRHENGQSTHFSIK